MARKVTAAKRIPRGRTRSESDVLARIEAAIETTRIPYIRVEVADVDRRLRPTTSKLGGIPYVPDGAELPGSPEPLAFVAQINFADFSLEPFPSSGLIQFWVAGEEDDGYGLLRKKPETGFRCIYYANLDRAQRTDLPQRMAGGPVSESRIERGRRLTFHSDTCVVSPSDCRWEAFLDRNDISSDLLPEEVYNQYSAYGHRIGGYCAFLQTDSRTPSRPDVSLLQLDSDEHVVWGDAGIAHWFIRAADLRTCNFARVRYDWDCA